MNFYIWYNINNQNNNKRQRQKIAIQSISTREEISHIMEKHKHHTTF